APQQIRGIDRLDEPSRVDYAAAPFLVVAAHELGKSEMRIHSRRRIEEPRAQLLRGARCVTALAGEVIRERQVSYVRPHRCDSRLIEILLALRIRLAVAADVRKPIRLRRVGPPIRAEAEVIVLVARR